MLAPERSELPQLIECVGAAVGVGVVGGASVVVGVVVRVVVGVVEGVVVSVVVSVVEGVVGGGGGVGGAGAIVGAHVVQSHNLDGNSYEFAEQAQLRNRSLAVFMLFGRISIVSRPVQFINAPSPIFVTANGIIILFRLVHP